MKMKMIMSLLLILSLLTSSGCMTTAGGVRQVDWPVVCNELDGAEAIARDFRGLAGIGSDQYEALDEVCTYLDEAGTLACAVADADDKHARVQALLKEGLRIAVRLIDDIEDEDDKRNARLAVIIIKAGLRRAGFKL